MSRRTRVPGPITEDQTHGNSGLRFESGINRWRSIDVNDGKWTLMDPNNGIVSVTTSTDGMRIVTDKDETAHRWHTGNNNQNAGRWYQKLKTPDGADLKWGDFFSIEFLVRLHALHANTPNNDKSGLTVGITTSTVGSDTTSIWLGGTLFFIGTAADSQLKMYVGGHDAMSNFTDADCRGAHFFVNHVINDDNDEGSDGNEEAGVRAISGTALNASGQATHPDNATKVIQQDSSQFDITEDVYVFVSANHSTTGGSTNNPDATWKVWYRLNVARDGVNPTYIPGGGESG